MKISAADKKEFEDLRNKFDAARAELAQWFRDQQAAGEAEFDEWSEKKQEGEKGQEFKERVDAFGEVADELEEAGEDIITRLDL